MITLRAATADDAATIVNVMQRAFQEYVDALNPPSGVHKETVESVRGKINTGQWVLAERAGEPVGCVWYEMRGDHVYLGRLSVPPEFRGSGIAGMLIEYVEAQARAQNISCVELSVRIVLEKMRGMYERRGYQLLRYETHTGYTEPTYVVMRKTLDSSRVNV